MAEALITGLLKAKLCSPEDVWVSDQSKERRLYLTQTFGVQSVPHNKELLNVTDIAVLSIKPQVFNVILPDLKETFDSSKLYVSIMAGQTLETLKGIGENAKIVRVMPNMPALVGVGMSGCCATDTVSEEEKMSIYNLLESVGKVIWTQEAKIDAITAVSGSGPAYVFYFAEVMIKAGVEAGLSEHDSSLCVKQMLLGASELMMQSTDTPTELREKISSLGGTTLAGLNVMKKKSLDKIMSAVVQAVKKRSEELGRE